MVASVLKVWWRDEPAKLPLNELGQAQRRAVLQVGADDLHADRQPGVGEADRNRAGRQADDGRHARPEDLVEVGMELAVNFDLARSLVGVVVVGKGGRGHW